MTQIKPDWLTGHGSPSDRGSADAYYGRPCEPHYWPDGTYKGIRVSASDMTDEQKNAYRDAYYSEENRKDWG